MLSVKCDIKTINCHAHCSLTVMLCLPTTNSAFDQVAAGEVDLAGLEDTGLAAEEVYQRLLRLPGMYEVR